MLLCLTWQRIVSARAEPGGLMKGTFQVASNQASNPGQRDWGYHKKDKRLFLNSAAIQASKPF